MRNPNAGGRTVHLDGTSYNYKDPSRRRTTVPADQLDVVDRIVKLFDGKSLEGKVEFVDTDGDIIAFVAAGNSLAKSSEAASSQADAEIGVVRSTFLFTDGLANVGMDKSSDICQAAESILGELGDRRCTISTFGFGADHNAELLRDLAGKGEGIYSYIEGEDMISGAFGEALGGLLSTTHQNVRLTLEVGSGVRVANVCTSKGSGAQVDGPIEGPNGTQTVGIDVGDIYAEERRNILISLALTETETEGCQLLGNLHARGFSVLKKGTETTETVALSADRQSGAIDVGVCNPQVERHRNRYVATEALEAAQAAAQQGDLARARKLLSDAIEILNNSSLTADGDPASVGFVVDLNDCLKDLRYQGTYTQSGSKKMACMSGSHARERACFGQGFSEGYSNKTMARMKFDFKEKCK